MDLGPSCLMSLFLELVIIGAIYKIASGLKNSSSFGPDSIPTNVVKSILPSIVLPLTKFCNLLFEGGVFLDTLKQARVIVLYKYGPRNDLANYRPNTSLSVLSKIFEID